MNFEIGVYVDVANQEELDAIVDSITDLLIDHGKGAVPDPEAKVLSMITLSGLPDGGSTDEWLEQVLTGTKVVVIPTREEESGPS